MPFELFKGLFGGDDYYGRKPQVPEFKPLKYKPGKLQRDAIRDNLKSFAPAKKLAKRVNIFHTNELRKMLERSIPQFQSIMASGSQRTMDLLTEQNFADMLAGKIPQDVSDAVFNSGASRAIGGGYGGSEMHRNLVARDLGLTSLDLIGKGAQLTSDAISSAERWLTTSKALTVPGQMNVSGMFISPTDRVAQSLTVDAWNNSNQWNRNWLEEQIKSGPDPAKRGRYETEMSILSSTMGMVSGLMGGGGGSKIEVGGGGGGGTGRVGAGTQEAIGVGGMAAAGFF